MTRLFIEGVTGIDCGILDSELGLIGQSWLVDLNLEGPRNAQGMVIDFGIVKPALRDICRHSFDHRLLVPLQSPSLQQSSTASGLRIEYTYHQDQRLSHLSPEASVRHIETRQVSRQVLEETLALELSAMLNGSDIAVTIRLREAHANLPNGFRYTHGLRQHHGECQRIGHGHASQLEIRVDGVRSADDESTMVTELINKHIVASADIIARQGDRVQLGYDAVAGRHELELPASRVFALEGEATVENIAEHIAEDRKDRHAGRHIEVTVWEGTGKGATAIRN